MQSFEIKLLEPSFAPKFQASFVTNDGTQGMIVVRVARPKGIEERLKAAALVIAGEPE